MMKKPEEINTGERFSKKILLTPHEVAAFARAAGDNNPIHHDPVFASTTRFGGLIASGAQTSSLLMAATASHFCLHGAMVGLEFSFRFRRPVYAKETVRIEWLIVEVRDSERLGGKLVALRGRMQKETGETAVGAKGLVLVSEGL